MANSTFFEIVSSKDGRRQHITPSPDLVLLDAWSEADNLLSQMQFCNQTDSVSSLKIAPVQFLEKGCVQDNGSINCTASCADSHLLAGYSTLWNCVTLARLATWSPMSTTLPVCNELYAAVKNAGKPLGVPDVTQFDAVGVLEDYFACANASCALVDFCRVPLVKWDNATIFEKGDFLNNASICGRFTATINADVAGPGVSDSSKHLRFIS